MWKKVRLDVAPAGDSPPKGVGYGFRGLRRRDSKRPIWISVQYRGGAEDSWLVNARDRVRRFPGHMCLSDVMREINEGTSEF